LLNQVILTLPPGRLRLATYPSRTGSPPNLNTIVELEIASTG
jgi:hypothetical protein